MKAFIPGARAGRLRNFAAVIGISTLAVWTAVASPATAGTAARSVPASTTTVAAAAAPVVSAVPAAVATSDVATFVGGDGAVYSYSPDSTATAITAAGAAPAGAPTAVVRAQDGIAVTVYADALGAWRGQCLSTPSVTFEIAPAGLLDPGAPVAAALAGPQLTVAALDRWGSMQIRQAGVSPCGTQQMHFGVPIGYQPHPMPEYQAGAPFALAGFSDGGLGFFAAGTDGAVHARWVAPSGSVVDSTLTPLGSAGGRSGIAVAPRSNAATTPGVLALMYFNSSGTLELAHPVEGAGLTGPPQAAPGAPPASASAGVSAVAGSSDIVGGYIAADGSFAAAHAAPSGGWLSAGSVTGPGFAPPGSSVAMSASATPYAGDGYCGNSLGRPGHVGVPHPGGGPGVWLPSGPPSTVTSGTRFGAA